MNGKMEEGGSSQRGGGEGGVLRSTTTLYEMDVFFLNFGVGFV